MKNSLIACFMLFFGAAFGQSDLFISNGSYVFVDGTDFNSGPDVAPLFVTDDISMEANAHIYLRNDGQLIQGNGTTGNSGEGALSVYQNGTVNQWSYNYWCLPVGNNSVTNGNEPGRLELLNEVTGLTTANPALFTNALNGITSPLTISDRWLWTFQTSTDYADWFYVGPTGDINPGLGFTMKGMGTNVTGNQNYDFRGKPNSGTITNPIGADVLTLVGNPYPSAIDSAAFIHDADNVNEIIGTLFYWEQDGTIGSHVLAQYVGGYHEFTIDASGAIISNTPAQFGTYDSAGNGPFNFGIPTFGNKQAQRYIPIAQGFMVRGVATPMTSLVTVKNTHRVFEKEGADSYFFRNTQSLVSSKNNAISYQENGLPIVPSHCMRFRVNVDFSVAEGTYTRQLLLNFLDTATFGYDRGLELHRSRNLPTDAFFEQEQTAFSGLAYPFSEQLVIPFTVHIEEDQPLGFRIFDIQNFEDHQGIYLRDKKTNTYVNLRDQEYQLNITPGEYSDRFEIVFTASNILSTNNTSLTETLSIQQNNKQQQLIILNPNRLEIETISIFDINGKRITKQKDNNTLQRIEIPTSRLSDGVYMVNINTNGNSERTEKIIVKN